MNIADKLTTVAENVPLVYGAGYNKGLADGQAQGGGNSDEAIATLTKRMCENTSDYRNLFLNSTISNDEFKVIFKNWTKNNLPEKNAGSMFRETKNLTDALYDNSDKLDFSGFVSINSFFQSSSVTKLHTVDARTTIRGWNGMTNAFYGCGQLERIEHFYPSTTAHFSAAFAECYNLSHIIFESEISTDYLNLSYSESLDKKSLMSVLYQLKDYAGTGTTMAVSLGSTNLAKLTDAEKAIATQKGWSLT